MTLDAQGFNREPGWRTYTLVGLDIFLGAIFILLKWCGIINWSWFIVLLPFYWLPAICLLLLAMAMTAIRFADAYREIEKVVANGKTNGGTTKENSRKSP